jgi:putative ATP-dependent endonuclease of OLD family
MYLSRIRIANFRNFSNLDIELAGNVVVVGENRVGKSNLLYALQLVLDPILPDSARQLGLSDFWDGLVNPTADDKIIVSIEIEDFEDDLDVLTLLTDFRLDNDPQTVRLTYECRAKSDLDGPPAADDDLEFVCYGGENESKQFGYRLRSRITMDVLPALRDAVGDLAIWRKSPLRRLLEDAFRDVELDDLEKVAEAIQTATEQIGKFDEVKSLEKDIAKPFAALSGPKQDVNPTLGFTPTDPSKLPRSIRMLIDDGLRGINEASLGSANLVFLTLKTLELQHMMDENRRDYTFLAIEEPEAHLHPHLQRSVYKHFFENVLDNGEDDEVALSVFLTTHSPHIASVAPPDSIVLLRDTNDEGTVGFSTAGLELIDDEEEDLTRYLDVTRAEILFARGVILVEGDAERFLIPGFADNMGVALDQLGITICSVAGTNFHPYVKFLTVLGIPFSVITDWDPREKGLPLGSRRIENLIRTIEIARSGKVPSKVEAALTDATEQDLRGLGEERGIFTNDHTLEIDLFNGGLNEDIIHTLRGGEFGKKRKALIDGWDADPTTLDPDLYLSLIESMGKGRFAQRLASRFLGHEETPEYIQEAIKFVIERV